MSAIQQALLAYGAAGGGSTALYDAIIADSPFRYYRHSEASGGVMIDQISTNGVYGGTPGLGNPALYSGGGTSVYVSNPNGTSDASTYPALTQMSLVTIVKLDSASGLRSLISRDTGVGTRKWQWRTNGTALEFVKIQGGVATVTSPSSVIASGVAAIVGLTVSTAGAVNMYVNGSNVHSASVAAADYGSTNYTTQIGLCAGGGGLWANGYFSESALFATELSGARMAAYAAAAGL